MATLVQSGPLPDPQALRQRHFNPRQQIQPAPSYTATVPAGPTVDSIIPNLYKQINIIPGLDPENAVVDTGVKLVRPTGNQVQVSSNTATANEYDGKRMRRSIQRRTVDYNASTIQMVKHRLYRRSILQKPVIQPDPLYYPDIVQTRCILYNPMNSVTTRFVRASTNKVRCPVFSVAWTPEGRRVVTGTSSGEFTLWNGLTFNFETILQAHESSVRAMEWSHNDMWLLSGDHNGVIKYWQSNMNNVKMIQAHTDPIRGLSFCPTDNKFITCSDDGLLKLWDFYRCQEERVLRGHGADVKCTGWHPSKCMVASGSKDSQQPLMLWDPRTATSLATIHGHKSTVMDLDWNKNGNWLLTGSRDRLVKVFDIRVMKEICTFRGHKKEAASVNWHPLYEEMFASGGSDGSIMFWLMGCEKELGVMENAHDGMIWDLKWHPLGHILCSGSNDHTTKFWTRNRPGDKMRDKYNLNVLPAGFEDDYEYELPNTTQSDDSQLDCSNLNSSSLLAGTSAKSDTANGNLTDHLNTAALKELLQQSSLEITKTKIKDTPAQIYTVSRFRPGAPSFKIDAAKQKKAIEEVERLEKRRERQLARGDNKRCRKGSNQDDASNAPSLLDLDIAPPAFLRDHDWDDDSKEPPFIDEVRPDIDQRSVPNDLPRVNNFQENERRPPNGMTNFDRQHPSSTANYNENRFDGPFDNRPNFDRPPHHPSNFNGNDQRQSYDGSARFEGPSHIDNRGPPHMDNRGPPPMDHRGPPPMDNRGPQPPMDRGPPPPMHNRGHSPMNNRGPPMINRGPPPPMDNRGPLPPVDNRGAPPMDNRGPPPMVSRGPMENRDLPPIDSRGPAPHSDGRGDPHMDNRGPSHMDNRRIDRLPDRFNNNPQFRPSHNNGPHSIPFDGPDNAPSRYNGRFPDDRRIDDFPCGRLDYKRWQEDRGGDRWLDERPLNHQQRGDDRRGSRDRDGRGR